ncbi:uncharacterized protein DUF4440 [Pseudoduganella flava]|uniref:DUF4440 domain-containing protein n=1 Tax=Pseudoduganella flava TaxID=871742 RepID=A0A562PL95_9BURK|nr:nuclear transport factor 2 family protein [Pseudoduganella flava]QGZ42416.1 DUF4440 domain-containing protein [Pseudoduganella flava]TWI44980.1 uncharacterized protein DUF4440 [Pseudoduganella flava]
MKRLLPLLASLLPCAALGVPCQPTAALVDHDRRYEEALRSGDVAFLRAALADDYVWVHSLGSQVESRAVLLERLQGLKGQAAFKSRTTSDVHVHAQGETVVLRGLSIVEQWNADGATFRTNRYQFMRTYVNVDGQCKLLAVQTMNLAAKP